MIHLGAKFAPCMRIDDKIQHQVEKTRTKERETACCIRNDDSGCVQSSRADCSVSIDYTHHVMTLISARNGFDSNFEDILDTVGVL